MTLEEYVALEAAAVSTDERKNMSDSDFAVPGKRQLLIQDATHVKLAWDMVDRTQGLTDAERSEARKRILSRAKELGVDTSNWKHNMTASAVQFAFADTPANPNRMPFKGILTYFDSPSDAPPGGSGGRKVLIPSSVGIPALDSLKGMGVNLLDDSKGHDAQHKIGVVTDAYTGELTASGLEVIVEGHIFARDFPREATAIKMNQSAMGFSYETANTLLASQVIDGEEVAVAESLVFTGAAILLKKAAAYKATSIAASKEDVINVTKEELQELLGAFKTDLIASVDAKVEAAMKKKPDEEDGNPDPADKIQTDQADDTDKDPKKKTPAEKGANAGGSVKASDDIAELVKSAVAEAMKTSVAASAETPAAPARRSAEFSSLVSKFGIAETETNLAAAIDNLAGNAGVDVTTRLALKLQGMKEGRITV